MVDLRLVDGDDQDTRIRLQQPLRQTKSPLHEGAPLGVPPGVIAIHVVVVVFPVAGTGVVRWVDVDSIHLTGVERMQGLHGMEIVRLDQDMPGRIRRAILDTRQGDQGGPSRNVTWSGYESV